MTLFTVQQVSVALNDMTGDAVIKPILAAPSANAGGGLTLVGATYFAGTATTSGTAHSLTLLKYNATGTLAGTVSNTIGGTASPFTTNSFNTFTLSDKDFEAGQYLVVRKNETNTSTPVRAALIVEYILGRRP